jgi:hypothetical protein
MPKELVVPARYHGSKSDDPSACDPGDPEIYLRWQKSPEGSGHLQFEIRIHRMDSLVKDAEENPAGIGTAYTATLERWQVNKFIRALRTARDDALGADA